VGKRRGSPTKGSKGKKRRLQGSATSRLVWRAQKPETIGEKEGGKKNSKERARQKKLGQQLRRQKRSAEKRPNGREPAKKRPDASGEKRSSSVERDQSQEAKNPIVL